MDWSSSSETWTRSLETGHLRFTGTVSAAVAAGEVRSVYITYIMGDQGRVLVMDGGDLFGQQIEDAVATDLGGRQRDR